MTPPKKRGLANSSPGVKRRVAMMGGLASNRSPKKHILTSKDRSRGGKNNPNSFDKLSPAKRRKIAEKGGRTYAANLKKLSP